MRLRNDSKAPEKLKALSNFIDKNQYPLQLNSNIIIEIGMGKGDMLCALAEKNPDKTYIGLEKFTTVAAKAAKKADKLKLKNLFIICDDAENINEIFQGTCNTIWLTFSDPWPKKRHLKRRLTYKTFLEKYSSIMNNDSILMFKSDNDGLYNYSLESLQENKWQIIDSGDNLHQSKYSGNNCMTEYELKWSSQGKNINYIVSKKPVV